MNVDLEDGCKVDMNERAVIKSIWFDNLSHERTISSTILLWSVMLVQHIESPTWRLVLECLMGTVFTSVIFAFCRGSIISNSAVGTICSRLNQYWSISVHHSHHEGPREYLSNDAPSFELEKRAFLGRVSYITSRWVLDLLEKTWLFVCHRSRFMKVGDYHTFEYFGSPIFVVLGKDLHFRAFHNVCRHRAYTVVRKACGNTTRFTCKYHGWQYDDEGKLVKAPEFDKSPSFDFANNGLFDLDVIVSQEGLIFVNFDRTMASSTPYRPKFRTSLNNWNWQCGQDLNVNTNWKSLG